MITIEFPDNLITFIEVVVYISAFVAGVIKGFDFLKNEETFRDFLTGDLDD